MYQVPSTVHAVQRPMMRARCQCHECFLRKTGLFRALGILIQSFCIWFSVILQIVLTDVYFTVFCSKPFWSQICKETFGNVCISVSAVASCKDQCSACLPVIRAMFSLSAGCKNNFLRRRSFTDGRQLPAFWDARYMIPLHLAKSPKKIQFFLSKILIQNPH